MAGLSVELAAVIKFMFESHIDSALPCALTVSSFGTSYTAPITLTNHIHLSIHGTSSNSLYEYKESTGEILAPALGTKYMSASMLQSVVI